MILTALCGHGHLDLAAYDASLMTLFPVMSGEIW